ncbi:hypothetical protein K490DRAFT_64269 [Saccharata proteae CBS 121410]|uniref:Uncharacterized protein n=1 Tax=Saccharata proteae CBS 121410 TaxID=1314787 RepID=A0A6A5YDM5_9PEZI|nr:hypothetical protein K490DRAFT_64269 [Saccharata proteae CBS 121410]
MPQYWEDEWYSSDYGYGGGMRHVPPRHHRIPSDPRRDYLAPEVGDFSAGGRMRSRSTGARPVPNIQIFNRVDQDMHPRMQQTSPAPSPRGRPVMMPGEEFAYGEDVGFRLGAQAAASRSRSRGPLEHWHHHEYRNPDPLAANPALEQRNMQLAMTNERIRELEERLRHEREEEMIKLRMEKDFMREKQEKEEEEDLFNKRLKLKLLKDKQEREEEEDRIKKEEERIKRKYELQRLEDEKKREQERKEMDEMRKRAIAEEKERQERMEREKKAAAEEYERKKMEAAKQAAEERRRILEEHEKRQEMDAKKQKEQEEALIAKLEKQKKEKEEKERREWEEFERKRKEKEEREKAAKAKKEKEFEEEMRKHLAQFGFQENQIQAMIKPEKKADLAPGLSPSNPIRNTPTYVKVHREHLSIDTLQYYGLPWEYDRTDTDYIVILREMDQKETDILFEHTRSLRRRMVPRLTIEERRDRDRPEYAWVRRRAHSKSPARRRSSPPRRIVGFRDFLM